MPGKPDDIWSVYMVRRNDGKIYTGIATDVERRFEEHIEGKIGAKFLRGMGPLELLTSMEVGSQGEAWHIEKKVKKLTKDKKENAAKYPEILNKIIHEGLSELLEKEKQKEIDNN